MPAMLSFIFECGNSTAGSNARLALRMRHNMSEIGSFIKLPAGLGDARDQPVEIALAEGHARTTELAQVAMAAADHGAAIHHAHGAGFARQFGEPGIVPCGLQLGPDSGILLDRFL